MLSKALLGFSVPDKQPSMTAHYNAKAKAKAKNAKAEANRNLTLISFLALLVIPNSPSPDPTRIPGMLIVQLLKIKANEKAV